MFITKLHVKNFRCFSDTSYTFQKRFVVIEGKNGTGKTSILEALHYICYLKSFRTHLHRELIHLTSDHFFVSVSFSDHDRNDIHQIQVGLSGNEKIIKFDAALVKSYKDIIDHYRTISITEDDLELVRGAPETRRMFLNQSLTLLDDAYLQQLRRYKKIASQRAHFLQSFHGLFSPQKEGELVTWSKTLWSEGSILQDLREKFVNNLEQEVNTLLDTHFPKQALKVSFSYQRKNIKTKESFDSFWARYKTDLLRNEILRGRNLFGAHLDDFQINFQNKKARIFASRGQQKLAIFLIKIAHALILHKKGCASVLLLDDFLTDFDDERFATCIRLLESTTTLEQVFITTPLKKILVKAFQNSDTVETRSLKKSP